MQIEKRAHCRINGFQLKLIAVITMLIDHIGAVLLEEQVDLISGNGSVITILYYICRMIGRLSFPIFCFLLTEGFFHSKNRYRYIGRMVVFAVISLWPFYMAFACYGNVLITFTIGLIAMTLAEVVKQRVTDNGKGRWIASILICIIAGIGYLLAEIFRSDYGGVGVLVILLLYFFHTHPILSYVIAVVCLGTFLDSMIYIAMAGIPFLIMYNGERGRQIKHFFYLFYPVHLVLLVIIKWMLFS